MDPKDYMYNELYTHANIIIFFEIIFLAVCNYVLNVYWFSCPPPLLPPFVLVSFLSTSSLRTESKLSVTPTCKSPLYNATFTINYSKEPLDVGVMDNPLPKKTFRPSPSSSPLKEDICLCNCGHDFHSRSGGFIWTFNRH